MRIRTSNRLALLAAVGVVLSSMSVAHLGATPTMASSSPLVNPMGITSSDFHQIALPGFGDPNNSWAWGSALYKGNLYIGTNRDWQCVQPAALNYALPFLFPYPPTPDPDLDVQCNRDYHGGLSEDGEIWRLNTSATPPLTQTDWTRVWNEPYTVPVTDTFSTTGISYTARDMAYRSMTVYNDVNGDQALYVSGLNSKSLNGNSVPPPSLLRTTTGNPGDFQPVPADPGTTMGDINTSKWIPGILGNAGGCCMRGALAYNGKFYLVIGTVQGGGAVFVSSDPRQGDNSFQPLTPPGMQVFEMETFNGHLYLGLQALGGGYSVVQFVDGNCSTLPCPQSAFTQIIPAGGGLGSKGNSLLTSMHVFTDTNNVPHLYIGTDGALDQQPTEIVRINTDNSWDLVVGNPRTVNGVQKSPLSGLPQGFGWPFNYHMWRMATYENLLIVGTFDISTFYKDTSLGAQLKPLMGFDLWATSDGIHFLPITLNGLGDMFSYGARALVPDGNSLFVGSANWFKGLRIWQGQTLTSTIHLAPTAVHIDTTPRRWFVGLNWTPSSNAVLYHVYRSTETRMYVGAAPVKRSDLLGEDAAFAAVAKPAQPLGSVLLPHSFVEVGTTTSSHFVDYRSSKFGHYLYYVVAQDAQGHLSTPSNATSYPNIAP